MKSTTPITLGGLAVLMLGLGACERKPAAPVASDTSTRSPTDVGATPATADLAMAKPWRMEGQLLGIAADRAIVLADNIVSVDVDTGAVTATAVTEGKDPVPTFDRHLPRIGEEESDQQPVDRIAEMPMYVGGEVVVFMRGSDDVVTSLVGLDATTLEEAWTLPVAYKRPLQTCSTSNGVLMVPEEGPARFVDWLGQQGWLRKFGRGELLDVRCGAEQVQTLMKDRRDFEVRTFDAATGDLVNTEPGRKDTELVAEPTAVPESPVRQDGGDVVRTLP